MTIGNAGMGDTWMERGNQRERREERTEGGKAGGRDGRWEGSREEGRERQGKEGKGGFSLGVSARTLNPSFKGQTRQWLLDAADLFH